MNKNSTNKKSLRWWPDKAYKLNCLDRLPFWTGLVAQTPVNASLFYFLPCHLKKKIVSLKKGKRLNICRSHFGEQHKIVIVTPFERDIFFKRCGKRKKLCSLQVCTPTLFKRAACQIRGQVNFSWPPFSIALSWRPLICAIEFN